jgi:RNA polymerase sigma factor (sigma-70 family)
MSRCDEGFVSIGSRVEPRDSSNIEHFVIARGSHRFLVFIFATFFESLLRTLRSFPPLKERSAGPRPQRGSDLGRFAVVLPKSDGTPPVDPGDESVRSFVRSVRKMAWRRVKRRRLPPSSYEDVVQEVLVRALKHWVPLWDKDPGHRAAWVGAVMRNVVVDARRRRRRSLATDTAWPGTRRVASPTEENSEDASTPEERAVAPDAGPLAAAIEAELREAVARALDRLPEVLREEAVCWLLLGETRSQIARREGKTLYEVTTHVIAAVATLAKSLAGFSS